MTKTAIAISPMMTNVLSVATIPPATVTASHMARIAPRIVPMIRPMSPVCRRIYADGEPDAIIALPFPVAALGPVVVHGTIAALAAPSRGRPVTRRLKQLRLAVSRPAAMPATDPTTSS